MAMADPAFVDLELTLDAGAMADAAVAGLQASWDGWQPNDGDLEVVTIEELAPMAASVAQIASQMPKAALRTLGTKIWQIPYDPGAPATTTITLTVSGNGTLAGGLSQVAIDGYAFALAGDVVVVAGQTTVPGVPVTCTVDAATANGLTGDNVASLTLPVWVTAITVDAATANGRDPEDDDEYADKVSREMITRARTLVNARDLALDALLVGGVGRSYAKTSAARVVDVWLTDLNGLAVSSAIKSAVTARWADARMINITYNVHDPSYCQVNLAYSVLGNPGAAPADLTSSIGTMLTGLFDPGHWGSQYTPGASTVVGWVNQPVVHKNVVVAAIGNLPGVLVVESVTLSSTTPGAVVDSVSGDLTMPGTVALPQLGTVTSTIDYPT
jgi:hypothetical protein